MDDRITSEIVPQLVRVSLGSAVALGLLKGTADVLPTTIYLLTYHEGRCNANCQFCSQARSSTSRSDSLSRVTWPIFPPTQVISRIGAIAENAPIRRVCIQAVNYPQVFTDVVNLIRLTRAESALPISLSCQPFRGEQLQSLADVGLDRIGIPLDAATEQLFSKIKGPEARGKYLWVEHLAALEEAIAIFGTGHVSTHFIVGLGETDIQLVAMIQKMVDMGVYPALFAFTPIHGTPLGNYPRPSLARYRRIQLAQYLITKGKGEYSLMKFNRKGDLVDYGISSKDVRQIVDSGQPFLTSGCPNCNRPFYNENASGPFYNYPRPLEKDEIELTKKDIFAHGVE